MSEFRQEWEVGDEVDVDAIIDAVRRVLRALQIDARVVREADDDDERDDDDDAADRERDVGQSVVVVEDSTGWCNVRVDLRVRFDPLML